MAAPLQVRSRSAGDHRNLQLSYQCDRLHIVVGSLLVALNKLVTPVHMHVVHTGSHPEGTSRDLQGVQHRQACCPYPRHFLE